MSLTLMFLGASNGDLTVTSTVADLLGSASETAFTVVVPAFKALITPVRGVTEAIVASIDEKVTR